MNKKEHLKQKSVLLKFYADMVKLHPNNEAHVRQYAELLMGIGKETTGLDMLRHLHALLVKRKDFRNADALTKQYPMIGRVCEPRHWQEDIQNLLPSFVRSRLWLKLNQQRLREGQHLFLHGDKLDTIYLLCEGELAEYSEGENGDPVLLSLIKPGDVVAENKLLNPGAHKSNVVANKKSIVVRLPRKKILEALMSTPVLKKVMARKVERRALIRMISESPVLQIIPLDMRQHLVEDSYIREYAKGTTIHEAGKKLNHIDLIVKGEAHYQLQNKDGVEHLKTLRPGALVGESTAIHDTGCPANLVTKTGVTIVHISYAAFINVTEAYPPLRKKLTAYTAAQRAQWMSRLNELQTQEVGQ